MVSGQGNRTVRLASPFSEAAAASQADGLKRSEEAVEHSRGGGSANGCLVGEGGGPVESGASLDVAEQQLPLAAAVRADGQALVAQQAGDALGAHQLPGGAALRAIPRGARLRPVVLHGEL